MIKKSKFLLSSSDLVASQRINNRKQWFCKTGTSCSSIAIVAWRSMCSDFSRWQWDSGRTTPLSFVMSGDLNSCYQHAPGRALISALWFTTKDRFPHFAVRLTSPMLIARWNLATKMVHVCLRFKFASFCVHLYNYMTLILCFGSVGTRWYNTATLWIPRGYCGLVILCQT